MVQIYAGLDVSDKSTHICLVDEAGSPVWRGVCASDPQVLTDVLKKRWPEVARVVLETGALSSFLYHGLVERGVPAVCICARHAKGVLSAPVNKSDPHDAEGLAQLSRTGWFRAVHMKDGATHLDRACLKVREQLVRAQPRVTLEHEVAALAACHLAACERATAVHRVAVLADEQPGRGRWRGGTHAWRAAFRAGHRVDSRKSGALALNFVRPRSSPPEP